MLQILPSSVKAQLLLIYYNNLIAVNYFYILLKLTTVKIASQTVKLKLVIPTKE